MAALNTKKFRVEVISREEQTGSTLVRSDLQGYGGSLVLRIDREGWARLADAIAAFARLAPDPPAEVHADGTVGSIASRHEAHRSMKSVQMD